MHTEVWRLPKGSPSWTRWDATRVVGKWRAQGCETHFCDGGKLPEGDTNHTTGFPWHWVDPADTEQIRVVVALRDADCDPRSLITLAGVDAN